MNKKEFKELLKKCFGKNKDEKYHGIAMLTIYGIFLLILVLVIRIGAVMMPTDDSNYEKPTEIAISDIKQNNYSYTYTLNYNNSSQVFIGKRTETKEQFTYIENGISEEYIIDYTKFQEILLPDNYHYLDLDFIKLIIRNVSPTINNSTYQYVVTNEQISSKINSQIINQNNSNEIKIVKEDNQIKKIELDFSNYVSDILNEDITFTANLIYTDIGMIKDF